MGWARLTRPRETAEGKGRSRESELGLTLKAPGTVPPSPESQSRLRARVNKRPLRFVPISDRLIGQLI